MNGTSRSGAYDRFRAMFGSNEAVYIVYRANDGDALSEQSLEALQGLQDELIDRMFQAQTDRSSPLSHITDVKTLINVNFQETRNDALISRDFIGELPQNGSERDALRGLALKQPDYAQLYFSHDFTYGGFMLKTDYGARVAEEAETTQTGPVEEAALDTEMTSLDAESMSFDTETVPLDVESGALDVNSAQTLEAEALPEFENVGLDEYAVFIDALNEVLEQKRYTQAFTFYPVGNPVQMAEAHNAMAKGTSVILMSVLGLMLAMLWVSFRSVSGAWGMLWPVLIVLLTLSSGPSARWDGAALRCRR